MKAMNLVPVVAIGCLGIAAAHHAVAEERLDDLDVTMDILDDMADTADRAADLRAPGSALPANDLDLVEAQEAAAAAEEAASANDAYDAEFEARLAQKNRFRGELTEAVREGFIVDRDFEDGGLTDALPGPREDAFHDEEGEDVDLEDGFNDNAFDSSFR